MVGLGRGKDTISNIKKIKEWEWYNLFDRKILGKHRIENTFPWISLVLWVVYVKKNYIMELARKTTKPRNQLKHKIILTFLRI